MVYAGDQWIQLPTKDLYDTLMMAIAINAAKDMYEKGQQEMKDFKKEYGDFLTPITADQDWYNQNVTGKVRDVVNALYALGIDPLRNALGRAIIALTINNMPIGDIAKLRTSAANAQEFLKAKLKLQAEGKWNAMLDPYDGPSLSDYSTLKSGIWDRVSPTPYENMADFSKAYFDNIKPFKTSASKNGITYTKSEISMDDLRRIARQHHNDLVNTPQGQMMYKYYKDLYGSDEAARNAFDEAVVSGNIDRLYYDDNYDDNYFKHQNLAIQRENLNLRKQQLALKAAQLKAKELQEANRWTIRLREDIAMTAQLNKSQLDRLHLLLNETTFKGARQALIDEHKNGQSLYKFNYTSGKMEYAPYNPTQTEINQRIEQAKKLLGHYGVTDNDPYEAYYRAQSITPKGIDAATARALFDNFTTPLPTGDMTGEKSAKVTFGKESGLSLTRIRAAAYGNRNLSRNSASSKLLRYLDNHNVSGYRNSDTVSLNHRVMSDGVANWDANSIIRIRRSDLKGFGTDAELEAAVKGAGGHIEKRGSKAIASPGSISKAKQTYDVVDWIVLPVTRTANPAVMTDAQIDTYHEEHYGKKYAHAAESLFINEDLIDDYE